MHESSVINNKWYQGKDVGRTRIKGGHHRIWSWLGKQILNEPIDFFFLKKIKVVKQIKNICFKKVNNMLWNLIFKKIYIN